MTDRPILFSAPMIQALLDGRKTQTRRILKPQPLMGYTPDVTASKGVRFAKGDRLWVRETFSFDHRWTGLPPRDVQWEEPVWYWADGDPTDGDWTKPKPGIHMPRWASRITLTVADVRVERLQAISEADAIAEGCAAIVGRTWWQGYRDLRCGGPLLHQTTSGDAPPEWMIDPRPAGRSTWEDRSAVQVYAALWDTINRPGSWNNNPWVIALTFTVERRNIDHAR